MRGHLLVAAIVALSACSLTTVPDVTVPPTTDPTMRGQFAVGVVTRTYQRASLIDGAIRDHETFIWYPAKLESGQMRERDGNAGAAADRSGAPYPLIVWSHGLNSTALQSTILIGHLVSHGFVVVGPAHISDCLPESLAAQTGSVRRLCASIGAAQRIDQERSSDLVDMLDAVIRDRSLSDLVNTERIAAAGYSQGGLSALELAARDKRIKAVLALAPPARNPLSVIRVPTMLMASARDGRVPFAWVETRFEGFLPSVPRWLVKFHRLSHSQFTNTGCLEGNLSEGTCADTTPQGEAQRLIAWWSTAFLLKHVGARAGYDHWLDASNATGNADVSVTARGG